MRIVFFGVDELGTCCLRALLRQPEHQVVGVVTLEGFALSAPPPTFWQRLRGAQASEPRSVEELAAERGIPVLMPPSLRGPEFLAAIAAFAPEILVVACFDKILPAALLAVAPRGGINVHPSLLPRLRGPAPASRAIFLGDRTTGVTVHAMEATVDTGGILVQHPLEVGSRDTAGILFNRLATLAPTPLLEALAGLAAQSLEPRAQLGEIVPAPFLVREEAHLDWSAPRERLGRVIRSGNPYPGAFLLSGQSAIAVLEAELASSEVRFAPGTVIRVDAAGIQVQAGDGVLRATVLRAGGEIMAPRYYREWFSPGQVLVSGTWPPETTP